MFSSGRIPVRHPHVDLGLPTKGTGKYEWRGFLRADKHPHGTAPRGRHDRQLEQQAGAAAGRRRTTTWSYGSVHRNNLLEAAVDRQRTHTLASTVAAMNKRGDAGPARGAGRSAAIGAVLKTGPAPNARAQRMYELLLDWRAQGSSRLDLDLNGTIDHPGAAIMDKAWTKIADAVMGPVLGPAARRPRVADGPRQQAPTTRARRTAAAGTATSTRTSAGSRGRPVDGRFKTQLLRGRAT